MIGHMNSMNQAANINNTYQAPKRGGSFVSNMISKGGQQDQSEIERVKQENLGLR